MAHLIDRRAQRPRQERGQPRALPAPLQGADPGRGEGHGRRAHDHRHGKRRRGPRAAQGHVRAVVRLRPRRRPRDRAARQPRVRDRRPHPAPGRRGGGGGGDSERGGEGDSEDDFVFTLSREEFLQIFFDDLELPRLARTELGRTHRAEEHPRRVRQDRRAGQPRGHPHDDAGARAAHRARRRPRARRRWRWKRRSRWPRRAGDGRRRRRRCTPSSTASRGASDGMPFLDDLDLRYRNRVWRPGADRARGDVLPDGRVGVDGRGQEGPRQALLHAAVPVPDAQVRARASWCSSATPTTPRRSTRRRSSTTTRSAARSCSRRWSSPTRSAATATRSGWNVYAAQASDGDAFGADPGAQRALPARAPAAADALLHLPRTRADACRRTAPSRAVGRVRAAERARRQLRDAAGVDARDADLPGVPRAVPQGRRSASGMTPISHGADWDFELLERYDAAIAQIARRVRPRHLSEPDRDHHLRADARRLRVERAAGRLSALVVRQGVHPQRAGVQGGMQGLAYEIVINSDPCIAYLMEENTMTMQALVIAHACYGHNSFFKGNYLFRQWTEADAIIDYLVFARRYVMECEERYGAEAVEAVLDSCHALMPHGVDRYRRPGAADAQGGSGAPGRARGAPRAPVQRPVAHACRRRRAARGATRHEAVPGGAAGEHPVLRREVSRRGSSRGSASWCASCASSRSTSIRRSRPR